ncbi:MAG: spore coat U domain-containing protein [Nitrospirota bacterium]|nr:spore coat U domain-containing protein [Nitrospirota bacterium]
MSSVYRKAISVACLTLLSGCLLVLSDMPVFGVCSVSTAPVNFGAYDPTSPVPLDATGTVTVDCSLNPPPPNPPVNVSIDIGRSTTSGTFTPRSMRNAALPDVLNYNLYVDSGRTSIWGDGTGGTSIVMLLKINKNTPPLLSTVYGRIPAGQDVSAGFYADALIVTINW